MPSPSRRSARLRIRQYINSQFPLTPVQEPPNGPQELASTRPRKRPCSSEKERPPHAENPYSAKRPRISLQSVSDGSLPLSRHNLQKHNTLLMNSVADISRRRSRSKRPASQTRTESVYSESTITKKTASACSQKSSGTSPQYRHVVLKRAGIHIHHKPAPEETRAQINAVIQREVASERKEKLSLIAQQLSDSFIEVLSTAAGEDDCIEPFYNALSSMDHGGNLTFVRKAGIVSLPYPCTLYAHFISRLATKPQALHSAFPLEF